MYTSRIGVWMQCCSSSFYKMNLWEENEEVSHSISRLGGFCWWPSRVVAHGTHLRPSLGLLAMAKKAPSTSGDQRPPDQPCHPPRCSQQFLQIWCFPLPLRQSVVQTNQLKVSELWNCNIQKHTQTYPSFLFHALSQWNLEVRCERIEQGYLLVWTVLLTKETIISILCLNGKGWILWVKQHALPDSSWRAINNIDSNFFEQFGELYGMLNAPSTIHPVSAWKSDKERLLLGPHVSHCCGYFQT